MTKADCLERLRQVRMDPDVERAHVEADKILVAYLNDDEIRAAYEAVPKWYE